MFGGTGGVDMVWMGMTDYKICGCKESRTVVDTSSREEGCDGQCSFNQFKVEGALLTGLQEGPGEPANSLRQGKDS